MSVREPSNTSPTGPVLPPELMTLLERVEAFLSVRAAVPMAGDPQASRRWMEAVGVTIRELAWAAQRARNAMPKEQV